VATILLTGAGFILAGVLTEDTALLLQAFGAGALLAMVSETLLPEAAHEDPAFSGLVTAIGFAVLLLLASFT
jgi:ZIP family zinc transporter